MLDTWRREWIDRFMEELKKAMAEDSCRWDYYLPWGRGGAECIYTFIRYDAKKSLTYTINLKKIEQDKTSSSQKANEVIELVRRELLGVNSE